MNFDFSFKDNYKFEDLVSIVRILRGENGCDWDKVQTHKSIRNDFIEEVYEAIEAIDTDNRDLLFEELGDVLLQVVFHARISEENKEFGIDDVADGICKKLIHRHPHVFGDVKVKDADEVLRNWAEIKKEEKNQTTVAKELDDVARSLPSLMRTQKIIKRAHRAGVLNLSETDAVEGIKESISHIEINEEKELNKYLSDLLFFSAALLQIKNVNGEQLLYERCEEFINEEKSKE